LLAYDEESGKERKTSMYFFGTNNDVKKTYDNTVFTMKGTMGDYSIPAIRSHFWMFSLILVERGQVRTTRKFNTLKASKPEVVVETEDEMEFVIEEETVS
jgi:hypothetical protein